MYKLVPGSRGAAPQFAITWGLQEGYGPSGVLHALGEVVDLTEKFLKGCAANNQPYLTGIVSAGEVVYAWPEGPGASGGGHEPQATFSGEVNPLYNAALTAEQVESFLNDLAAHVGAALGQSRVYVAYNGDLWILQAEQAVTPTGETV